MQFYHDFDTDVSYVEPDYERLYFYAKGIIDSAWAASLDSDPSMAICEKGKEVLEKMEKPITLTTNYQEEK